jgi:cobalamin synthase
MAVAVIALVLLYSSLVKKKIGGMTGDTIGALIELAEIAALFTLAVL